MTDVGMYRPGCGNFSHCTSRNYDSSCACILNNWNEYYWASLVLITREKLTIPALLSTFTTAFNTNYNGLFLLW